MQFLKVDRYTARWNTYYDYSSCLYHEGDFIKIYISHIISLLTILNRYQVFQLLGYKKNDCEYMINSNNVYNHKFWLNIFSGINDYDSIEFFGKTMVYVDDKPTWIDDVFFIVVGFEVSELFLSINIEIKNDDWFPYYFINRAKVNNDYEKNGPRLESCLNEFFCDRYSYTVEKYTSSDVAGVQKGFKLENSYTTLEHELMIFNERGRFIDSIDLKWIQ